ncbi:MAG: M55 family metallopeptidase, partial [Symbiobacteriaceae bacterium]|nr:M55 family metallopeptidase [Symbiobacteriaceae bacterium]
AAEGFLAAGAEGVVINDSHGGMRNILIEELNPEIELITGSPKPFSMMEGVGTEGVGTEFGAVAFVGYHAKNGVVGILSHTMMGGSINAVIVNGRELGEGGINAAIAAEFGLPVIFVAGDQSACDEAAQDYKPLITVATKKAITRYSARSLTPQKSQKLIRAGAEQAYKAFSANPNSAKPFLQAHPCVIELRFHNSGFCDAASRVPGAIRLDGVTLRYEAADFMQGYKGLRAMMSMSS